MSRILSFLKPPCFEDEEKNREAFILNLILWVLILVSLSYFVYGLFFSEAPFSQVMMRAFYGLAINGLLLLGLRRGFVRPASIVQVAAFWIFFTFIAWQEAGIHHQAYQIGYPMVIAIAGFLVGLRGALIVLGLSLLSGGLMVAAADWGWRSFRPPDKALTVWFVSAILFPLLAILQYLFHRLIRSALTQATISQAQYRNLVEHLPQRIFIKDRHSKYLSCNPHFAADLGITPEQIVGRDDRDFFPQELAEQYRRDDQAVTTSGVPRDVEERYVLAGQERWVHTVKVPYRDHLGQLIGVLGIFEDITRRKRAEEALRESNQRNQDILNAIQSGVFLIDLETHNIVEANPAALAMFGGDREEIINHICHDCICPAQKGRCPITDGGQELDNAERELIKKDGTRKPILKTVVPVMIEGRQYLLESFIDISERKEAEESLLRSEERYRNILASITEGYYEVDLAGNLTFFNDSLCKMLGYSREELMGMNNRDYTDEENARTLYTAFHEVYRTGIPVKGLEFQVIRKDRTAGFGEVSISPIADQTGGITGFRGMVRDITERRRAEEEREALRGQLSQAQKMESIGRLAGGVAHDFNNMLGVILGHTEMALEQAESGHPLQADLQRIQEAARRSADLTRQLLAFARKQTIAPRVVDLNEAVQGLLGMIRRLLGEGLDLVWKPAKDLWPIKIDPSQIDQILTNLCVNAGDAVEGLGQVIIETENMAVVEADSADPGLLPGEYVMLAVSDDGCGMDSYVREHLFEPFFTTKGVGQGTGLGLATVYGIVKQNQGYVQVISEPRRGTTIKVLLHRYAGAMINRRETEASGALSGHGETILLVEDDAGILHMVRSMLEKLGYQVLAASTPGEALNLAQKNDCRIQLLLTDVIMPEMNGRDLAARLQGLCPDLKLLFMSGYTAEVIARQAVLEEGVHFIQKPFAIKDLAVQIREALGDALSRGSPH